MDLKNRYLEEIQESEEFFKEKIGEKLKENVYWNVCVYPGDYEEERININEIEEVIDAMPSGRAFPSLIINNTRSFSNGVLNYNDYDGYRFYKSGLLSAQIISQLYGKKELGYEYTINFVTQIFRFIKQYYEKIAGESLIHVEIELGNIKGVKLVPSPSGLVVYLRKGDCISEEKKISYKKDINYVEIKSSFKEIANDALVETIFPAFNLSDKSLKEKVMKFQNKFLGMS